MITDNSRYQQGTITRMPDENGNFQLAVLRTVPQNTFSYTIYLWNDGDRPDAVAASIFGDASLWWAIMDINPEVLDPTNIPGGTPVRIPTGPIIGQGTTLQ